MRLGPLGYHDTVVNVAYTDSGTHPLQCIARSLSRGQYLRATIETARKRAERVVLTNRIHGLISR